MAMGRAGAPPSVVRTAVSPSMARSFAGAPQPSATAIIGLAQPATTSRAVSQTPRSFMEKAVALATFAVERRTSVALAKGEDGEIGA